MAEAASARAARLAWALLALVSGAMALLALLEWSEALLSGRPILYGEGAVAHAAILFRDANAYRDASGTVAANYPPLYLALASIGDPFRVGRAVTIASALAVAAVLWWRARTAGPLASIALALTWLALAPVAIWGAAVKPDLLAVALALAGVTALDRSRTGGRGAFAAGALLELALWTKPTEALVGLAMIAWAAVAARPTLRPLLAGFVGVAAVMVVSVVALGAPDVWRHVVTWNALPWSAEQTLLVLALAAATIGIVLVAAILGGGARGIALAYLVGASGIVLLAGREGATINYLLDLAAATGYALATVAPRLRASGGMPIAAMVQLALAVGLLTPFGIVPGRAPTTGAWGQPERAAVVDALGPGTHLVEDSGLLVARGREVALDDLFLWSRLVHAGIVDGVPVIERVRARAFASVVSEADLARLESAPAYERARWHPDLVRAVLDGYALERSTGILWVYRPR